MCKFQMLKWIEYQHLNLENDILTPYFDSTLDSLTQHAQVEFIFEIKNNFFEAFYQKWLVAEEFKRFYFLLLPRTPSYPYSLVSEQSPKLSSHRQGVHCRWRRVYWSKILTFFPFSPAFTGMSSDFIPFCGHSCRFYFHRQGQRFLEGLFWRRKIT